MALIRSLSKVEADLVYEILNGRELTPNYEGCTLDEAIVLEQIIFGMTCSHGREYAEKSVLWKRKNYKRLLKRKLDREAVGETKTETSPNE